MIVYIKYQYDNVYRIITVSDVKMHHDSESTDSDAYVIQLITESKTYVSRGYTQIEAAQIMDYIMNQGVNHNGYIWLDGMSNRFPVKINPFVYMN